LQLLQDQCCQLLHCCQLMRAVHLLLFCFLLMLLGHVRLLQLLCQAVNLGAQLLHQLHMLRLQGNNM
jgi:hypothetical protein